MTRALVTGADGFVGRHLTAHLRASGDDVVSNTADITDRDALLASFDREAAVARRAASHGADARFIRMIFQSKILHM